MVGIYLIGTDDGPFWLGQGKKPETELAGLLVQTKVALRMIGHWDMPSAAAAKLSVDCILRSLGNRAVSSGGWWPASVRAHAVALCAHFHQTFTEKPDEDRETAGQIIRALRTNVLKTSQAAMGQIMGISEGQVSRIESGMFEPSWSELSRLRRFCDDSGLPWCDDFLFRPAKPGELEPVDISAPASKPKRKANGKKAA